MHRCHIGEFPCVSIASNWSFACISAIIFPFCLHVHMFVLAFQIYSPHLDTAPPRWVHLAHGILLFLYQVCSSLFTIFEKDVYLHHIVAPCMGDKAKNPSKNCDIPFKEICTLNINKHHMII